MKTIQYLLIAILIGGFSACKKETRDKISNTKRDVSNVSSVISNAKESQKNAEELQNTEPLSNEELKSWLPETLKGMDRTGFSVGKTGYAGIASIKGTFKDGNGENELKVEVIDGAGPGSILIMSYGMYSNMEVEEEDENKHLKTVSHNGIKAQQTYYKKNNDTKIQLLYDQRFAITVNAKNMDPDQTWNAIEKLNFKKL